MNFSHCINNSPYKKVKYLPERLYFHKDIIMKAILCGNSTVGKTSILNALTGAHEFGPTTPTLGAGCANVTFQYQNEDITMNVWDTAGQEAYRSLIKIYFRDTRVAILVFDVTSKPSFDAIDKWVQDIYENCGRDNTPILIAANKIDLIENRVISSEELTKKARHLNCPFMEISAKMKTCLMEMMTVAYRMAIGEKVPIDPTENFLATEIQHSVPEEIRNVPNLDLNSHEESKGCCS